MLGISVQVDAALERFAQNFSQAVIQDEVIIPVINQVVYRAARQFYVGARVYMQEAVYNAPAPTNPWSTYQGRTGRTMKALTMTKEGRFRITSGTDSVSYEVFVDRSDYTAYYYAWILNYGGTLHLGGIMPARLYWSQAVDMIQLTAPRIGKEGLGELKRAVGAAMARAS